jgi:hypothetical protein
VFAFDAGRVTFFDFRNNQIDLFRLQSCLA